MEEQAIRFITEGGRRIAWTSSGSGPPLVFSGWWMSHLELNWRDPRSAPTSRRSVGTAP